MGINGKKLALLIPRLATDFEGEVVATVRAIRRLLEADGHDLHDLARVVAGEQKEESRNGFRRRRADTKAEPKQEESRPDDIVAIAEGLLKCAWLSTWEREFLESIRDQARDRGFKLSPKQQAIIDKLMQKRGY